MERRLDEVVDVMRVPAEGDPGLSVRKVGSAPPDREIECEVLVAGGGMGGVAAALAAARRGCRTCLIEETDWLGGQLSAQGVSALDEHTVTLRVSDQVKLTFDRAAIGRIVPAAGEKDGAA